MIESPLLEYRSGYIGGRWVDAKSGALLQVRDPATGEHLSDVPDMNDRDAADAVKAAAEAMTTSTSIAQRQAWLSGIARLLGENKSELARIITREQGKPIKESEVEVDYSSGFFTFFARTLHHLEPQVLPERARGMRWMVHHRPAGVAALITPWNFPLAMLAKKLAPALAAGCAVVVKPADATPLTTIALWQLLTRLTLPAGLANLVIGKPGPIADVFCSHPAVRVISFTGSTAVGKMLAQKTAPHIKRLSLELGGNAPFIVMDDADVNRAVEALMANKFRCAGQTCVCANRVYVQRGVEETFTATVAERVAKLRVGNGSDPQTDIGPLINRAAFEKVERHVRDAIGRGAKRLVGRDVTAPAVDHGAFFPPTVLSGATEQMQLSREETFGPVVAIERFEAIEEAVAKANGTPFGLAAYLFTRDGPQAQSIIAQLRFGHVGLNTATGPTPEAPFGGMKESGFGREGGIEGLMEFTETQTVVAP